MGADISNNDVSNKTEGTTPEYESTKAVLEAASKYLVTLSTLDCDEPLNFALSEGKARLELMKSGVEPPFQRLLGGFVGSAFTSFITNRARVETKSARERELLVEAHIEEIERVRSNHIAEIERLTKAQADELERFKQERERQEEKDARRKKGVKRAHKTAFVVALFLVCYSSCMKAGEYHYAVASAFGVAASMGLGAFWGKTLQSFASSFKASS